MTHERPGGRSQRVVESVLHAALEELARTGYADLRIEDVAERAGVNKTTVYRRWPTKLDLLAAALEAYADRVEPTVPDTGDLRGDLHELAHDIVRRLSSPEGHSISRMVTTEGTDPKVVALARRLRERLRQPWRQVVERAIAQGHLPAESDVELVVQLLVSPIVSRLVRTKEKVDARFLDAVVELVVTGAEHGGAVAREARPAKKPKSAAKRDGAVRAR